MKQTKTHLSNAELLSIRDGEHLNPDARDHLARCEYCQDMLKQISEDADLIRASRPKELPSEAGRLSNSLPPETVESASFDAANFYIDETGPVFSSDEEDGLFGKRVTPEPDEPLPQEGLQGGLNHQHVPPRAFPAGMGFARISPTGQEQDLRTRLRHEQTRTDASLKGEHGDTV